MVNDLNSLLGLNWRQFSSFFPPSVYNKRLLGFLKAVCKQSLRQNSEFSLLQGKMSGPTFCVISACPLLWNRRVHNDYQLKCPQSLYVLTFLLDFRATGNLYLQYFRSAKCKHIWRTKVSSKLSNWSLKASRNQAKFGIDRKEWLSLSYIHLFLKQYNNYIWDFVISVFS